MERSRPRFTRSKLGLYYELLPNGGKSLLPRGKPDDELEELLVFAGIYAQGEKVPYSDAIPFALN